MPNEVEDGTIYTPSANTKRFFCDLMTSLPQELETVLCYFCRLAEPIIHFSSKSNVMMLKDWSSNVLFSIEIITSSSVATGCSRHGRRAKFEAIQASTMIPSASTTAAPQHRQTYM